MAEIVKDFEAGLAGESAQDAMPNSLTHTSSRTNIEHDRVSNKSQRHLAAGAGHSGDLTRVPTDADAAIDAEKGVNDAPVEDDSGLLTGFRLYAVFGSLMLGCFLFALDQSIVATAIPVFVSDFHAFSKVSWVITGYFLTQCGLILLVGQLLSVVTAKWVLLGAFFFFELGSLISGVAKSMDILIFGRAVQGIGTSGMFSSMMLIITVITKVEQRAAFMASFGFVFVISSVIGPLLGGVFTQHATWRWCFYINLPIGGLAAAAVTFLLPARPPTETERTKGKTTLQRLAGLDYLGTLMIFGIITCLLLALSDGGNAYAWSNWRIIFEFVLGGVLIIAFAFWELRLDEAALIPKSILKNRTVVSASIALFMTMLAMLGGTYQLPLFYEAVKDHSPTKAGIDIIAFMLAVCVAIFISGGATTATGRYYYWTILGPIFSAAGFGLLYTIDADTKNSKLLGYQILAGVGIGFSFQNILLAPQAEFHPTPHLMPQAVGVSNFFQLTGAAIGIGIVNTVQSVYLNKELPKRLPTDYVPLVRQSVTAIYQLPADLQRGAIEAYVKAITSSFVPIFIAVALAFVSAIFIRNHSLKERGGAGAMAA